MFNIEQIFQFLPHRYPFLLVDRVLEMEKGKFIKGIKNVTINEPFFQGHFPGLKIMPGVLVIEAIAQAGGILLYHTIDEPQKKIVFLSKIDNVKFRRTVTPGDQLRLEAELLKLKSRFCHVRGRATVEEDLVVEGDILASIMSLEELNVRK